MLKFGMPISKSKDILLDSNSCWKYNFDIEVKGQVIQSSWMYATHPTMVIHSRAKQRLTYVKGEKSWGPNTNPCHKPNTFDLKVKIQGWIRIINVLDTFSYSDRPMWQIWYANIRANRGYKSDKLKCWGSHVH